MTRRRWWLVPPLIGLLVVVVFEVVPRVKATADPRIATVQAYLQTEHADESWYPAITGLSMRGNDLHVRTNLPPRDFTKPGMNTIDPTARAIYETLWHYVEFEHRELRIYHVFILDRRGAYLDGGAA